MFAKNLNIIPISVNRICDFYEWPINPFSARAGNRNDIDPSSFVQFSITMLFGANLKYTNKLYRLQTHLTFYATTFHCHIVESKEFTRSEIWNSLLATKSRAACGPIPLPFSAAFPPEMVDFWESKMGNHENSEPDHLKYHFLNQHLKKPTKFRF